MGEVAAGGVRGGVGDVGGYAGYGAVSAYPYQIQGKAHIEHPEVAGGVGVKHEEHTPVGGEAGAAGQALGAFRRSNGQVDGIGGAAEAHQRAGGRRRCRSPGGPGRPLAAVAFATAGGYGEDVGGAGFQAADGVGTHGVGGGPDGEVGGVGLLDAGDPVHGGVGARRPG